ncbi:tetratricopeptide repeat protein [Bacillus luteolus]|uniref:Tetratricopeptide repeat protein n=1 Tax=Litchfieldia luteola TaxID=682179 RepID=A0ABR9QFE1_9BACI|nr:tetratricopeptide repeat protein [Cytobacillus luteolus]MBE4907210.1 tetratricopeptide repeat protein [Cytobacillus luteolus]
MNLLKRGVEMGSEELGETIFKEDKGHFWGLIETRPFMRAKSNYAFALRKSGNTQEAIKHYEELLELNPMDNQGVRYELIEAYLATKSIKKAKDLLKKYPEDSTDNLYNLALIEYMEHGNTVKLKKYLKEAKKHNPFVGDYLSGKKKLPSTLPEYYGWGDENEAIVYAAKFKDVWTEEPALLKIL